MTRNIVWLGPAPAEESCAKIGDDDYQNKAMEECNAYVRAIRRKLGPEPEGAQLRVQWETHEWGRFAEVVCVYDGMSEKAAEYAHRCDEHAPVTWEEAFMEAPRHSARGR